VIIHRTSMHEFGAGEFGAEEFGAEEISLTVSGLSGGAGHRKDRGGGHALYRIFSPPEHFGRSNSSCSSKSFVFDPIKGGTGWS
jgi:hypothetical protein